MLNSLEQVKTDYIILFLEDYILTKNIKINVLDNIINLMKNENIDHISLMSYEGDDWEILNVDYKTYDLKDNIFLMHRLEMVSAEFLSFLKNMKIITCLSLNME